jgi:hypothetical protein
MKIWSVLHREWAKVEEDSRRALALDDTLVKVPTLTTTTTLSRPLANCSIQTYLTALFLV